MRRLSVQLGQWVRHVVLGLVSFAFAFPMVYIVLTSLKDGRYVFKDPRLLDFSHFTFANFGRISNSALPLGRFYLNSTIITIGALALVVLLGAAAGYGLSKFEFPGRKLTMGLFVVIMTFPVGAMLIPLFIMEFHAGIQDTLFGLILPNVAINLPFSVFIMHAVYQMIPDELTDSATLDGCGPLGTWVRIMMPVSANGLLVVAILYFGVIWGEYALGKVLATSSRSMPLAVGLMMLKGEQWDYALMSAIILVGMLPSVLAFLYFRRYFVTGIALGSVKG